MSLLRDRKGEPPRPTEEAEIPRAREEKEREQEHEAGDIEPVVDAIGYKVFVGTGEKDFIGFPADKYGEARILSELLKLKKIAEE
jgi:hypothetical protein